MAIDITTFVTSFSIDNAIAIIQPLAMFIIGIIIYAVFIFKVYGLIATRDIFEEKKKYKEFKEDLKQSIEYSDTQRTTLHILEYIFFYPLILFFFFIFFFILLIFIKGPTAFNSIMLVAMAIIGSVRVVSYYSEELARDLAKMLPLALLAIFMIELPSFSIMGSLDSVMSVFGNELMMFLLIYYFIFIILMEFVLRIVFFSYKYISYE